MSWKVALQMPRGLWAAAVVVMVVLGAPVAEGRDSPQDFVYQFLGQCYFTNGTERVRLVVRYIYNREETTRFDSDWGEHGGEFRAVEPTVTISTSRTEALNQHNLLVCSVTDFYPSQIKVRWFRNGQEETAGVVSTPLIKNGDWTYQILVMLEMTPQQGDVYTCHVEHPSLQSPVEVEWRAQSESARSKMLSGVGGFVLGLIFLGLGLFIRHRSQKEQGLDFSETPSQHGDVCTCHVEHPSLQSPPGGVA
ncbi:Rano class II histocompatibility antigen; B-1 beta chain [Camelus dromedarius]|uniref:Rano class II histocompatibility antigen n=1 Tax=Camelus dromedarius TaxID=9838 RepID=A0A5N4CT43_CAMDR|nr:Rano class II histocompatibility antigen; B-1 beta chain [Camelus dromedarius]